ncbi:MAG: CHASE4 domain-containing protein [Candidatus Omnitrophota bacterium]
MKIQTKLIFLLSSFIIISVILVVLYINIERGRVFSLVAIEKSELQENFNEIIELKGKSMEVFANDYAYWDDMVSFVKAQDAQWAEENIETGLKTFDADAVWVYTADSTWVYSVNNLDDDTLKEIPLPKGALEQLFSKDNRFCHFFTDTSKGLMEVFGATIHPTIDVARETNPQGFYLVGRLWDEQYTNELSKLTNSNVIMSTAEKGPDIIPKDRQEVISFSKILNGWDKDPVMRLNVQITSNIAKDLKKTSSQLVFLVLIFVVLNAIIFLFFLQRWVNLPLSLISLSLKKEESSFLYPLEKNKDEFYEISKLIRKFFEQKKELIGEIEERKRMEKEITERENFFSGTVNDMLTFLAVLDPEGNIIFVNNTALKIAGLTLEQLRGKKFYDTYWWEYSDEAKKKIREDIEQAVSGKSFSHSMQVKTLQGLIWIEFSIHLVFDHDGNIKYIVPEGHDITNSKKIEEVERKHTQELEIFNKASIGREEKIIELKNKIKELEDELNKKG